jgi:hypothetical protein
LLVEASALLVNLPQEQLEGVDLDALGWKIYEQDQPIMEMSEGS